MVSRLSPQKATVPFVKVATTELDCSFPHKIVITLACLSPLQFFAKVAHSRSVIPLSSSFYCKKLEE